MSSAISHQDLSDLIGRIYDCTLDPSRWESALDAIRTLLQCPTAQLFLMDLQQHRVLISKDRGMDARLHETVGKHIPEIHQRLEHFFDNGMSMEEPFVVSRMFSPEAFAGPYYQDAVSLGFIDFIQTHLMRSPTRMSALGFGRHQSAGVFGDREVELMRLLILTCVAP
jgi:hypothetical protein